MCTTMMCKERLSPPKRMKSWNSFRVKCKCECIPKNPQKIPRKEGGGRVEDCLRLLQKIPPFFMSFPQDYLFLSLSLTQMFSIWYQHICMWFCLRDPDFWGVFFWTFRSIFSNFPEYFSEFCGGIFSEFSRVFFQIFSIFLNLSTKIKWRPSSFFVLTSIFPNSCEYFLTFLTEFSEYFFSEFWVFFRIFLLELSEDLFSFLVLTSIFPEFPEHFEYFP